MPVERRSDRFYLGVVTPMANEEDTAVPFVQQVLENCRTVPRTTVFVVLDRVSRDGTRGLLEQYARREPRLRVVWAPQNRCVVDAYLSGYREALSAGCDWILEMDAGFSHPPLHIPAFLACIPEGFDCAFGSRFCASGVYRQSWKRKLVSHGGTWLSNAMLGTRLSDMTSGFELFSREALELVLEKGIHSRAHFFQTEIRAYCHGLRIREVPIVYSNPSPRLSNRAIVEAFRQLGRLTLLRMRGQLRLTLKQPREPRQAVAQ